MMNSKRSIYIYESLLLIYLLLMQFFIIILFKSFKYLNYIQMIIWLLPLALMFIKNGFPRDNNYFKKLGVRYAIIYCFIYIIGLYCLGFLTGFSHSVYSHTIINLFNNVFPVLIITISMEMIRYIICKKSNNNTKSLVFITIIYILYDLLLTINYYDLSSSKQIFLFLCLEFCSITARHILFTYITYNISLIPTLILAITLKIFWFIVPVIPSLGDYINSVLGILMPYLLYLKMRKMIKSNDYQKIKKSKKGVCFIIIFMIIATIIVLVAGIGKYKIVAIGSDSMNPVYYKGDAVIYEKVSTSLIKEEDILVFSSGGRTITHRVVEIIEKGNTLYFRTKGDNNNSIDIDLVSSNDVFGKVKYIVKYVGYPTVIIQEIFNK